MVTPAKFTEILSRRTMRYTLPSGFVLVLRKPRGRLAYSLRTELETVLGPLFMAVLGGKVSRGEGDDEEPVTLHDILSHNAPRGTSEALISYLMSEEQMGTMLGDLLSSVSVDDLENDGGAAETVILHRLAAQLERFDRDRALEMALELAAGRGQIQAPVEESADGDGRPASAAGEILAFPDDDQELAALLDDVLDINDLDAFTARVLEYTFRPS